MKAVIFDMDGLLIDSEPLWRRAEIEVFESVGLRLTEEDCEQTTGLRTDEIVGYWYDRRPWAGPPPDTESADGALPPGHPSLEDVSEGMIAPPPPGSGTTRKTMNGWCCCRAATRPS